LSYDNSVTHSPEKLGRLLNSALFVDSIYRPGEWKRETDLTVRRTRAQRGVAALPRPDAARRPEAALTDHRPTA
jgi:hypothetical protein